MSSSSNSVSKESSSGKKRKRSNDHNQPVLDPVMNNPSPTTASTESSGVTVEEMDIDIAGSLIFLSQGRNEIDQAEIIKRSTKVEKYSPYSVIEENIDIIVLSRQSVEPTTRTTDDSNKYECKTCNMKFSSFQALGGHRTSHSRTRLHPDECKVKSYSNNTVMTSGVIKKPPIVSKKGSQKKEKEHKCEICSTIFSSGQALGGHMGKHRPLEYKGNGSKKKKGAIASKKHPDDLIDMPSSSRQTDTDRDSVGLDRATEEQPPNGGLPIDLNLFPQEEINTLQLPSGSSHPENPPPTGRGGSTLNQ